MCSGRAFFQIGSAYLQGSDLAAIARPHLEALRDAVGETAYLVIFSRGEIVQLCKADGKQAVSASVRSMVREPAYCTATGKVLLAGLAAGGVRRICGRPSSCRPSRRRRSPARPQLRKEIAKVRASGFAVDIEEFVPNLCCVSVPVHDREGSGTIAAISIAMPKMRFKRALRSALVRAVARASRR